MSSMKTFQRTIDGRGALQAIQCHNMGDSKWDKVMEDAELVVQTRMWNGKNSIFLLKAHINKHSEAHNDFVRASQHVDYEPPNEHTRVSRLLKCITTSDQQVIAVTTTILAYNAKHDDLELASDFLILAAPQKQGDENEQQRISAIYQGQCQDKVK